jgi:hypothetical protein
MQRNRRSCAGYRRSFRTFARTRPLASIPKSVAWSPSRSHRRRTGYCSTRGAQGLTSVSISASPSTRCPSSRGVAAQSSGATLLRLMPMTGRTHQLRAHAARAGSPLFGDPAYGGKRREVMPDGTVVTARRVMLHCARLSFPSPSGGAQQQFEAPARSDMQKIWIALGGAASDLQP